MVQRRNSDASFKARVVLETVTAARTVFELATADGFNPAMIDQGERPLLEGAKGTFKYPPSAPRNSLPDGTSEGLRFHFTLQGVGVEKDTQRMKAPA